MKYYAYGSKDPKKLHVIIDANDGITKVDKDAGTTVELEGPVTQITDNPNWKEISASDVNVGSSAKASKKTDE
jgi:hypothetical protein